MRRPACFGAITAAILLIGAVPALAQSDTGEDADPFIGDWQGTLTGADGTETPIVAQVINWGRGGYEARFLEAFDQRMDLIQKLTNGKAMDGGVAFEDVARIADGVFTGQLTGDHAGAFRMEHVDRLSSALGAAPPEGAVILFDGTSMGEWYHGAFPPFVVDLAEEVGGDDCVAYLRARVESPRAQNAVLEIGSDDFVRAQFNGEVVDECLEIRALVPWEDSADIELAEGWNEVLLESGEGHGPWVACARIRSRDGRDLEGLRFDPEPKLGPGERLSDYQGGSSGTIITWEVAGPYTVEGKSGAELFGVQFPPETDDTDVEWRVANESPRPLHQWRLVEGGAMEVVPGIGAIRTNREFTDHKIHLEFRTPLRPDLRGLGRGNSGVYVQGRHEVQILDSYGLEGDDHHCGAIYGVAAPLVNMCSPPGQWQGLDIEFRAARYDETTSTVEDARMTVHHNGVLIHDDAPVLTRSTNGQPVASGALMLQDHGNRVQFRNIWVVDLSEESE